MTTRTGRWLGVWERRQVRRLLATMTVVVSMAAPWPAVANPSGEQVRSGTADFERSGSTLTITQHSDRAIIDWQNFSIGQDELTQFIQSGASSAVLNRVIGGDASAILGSLKANGQVYLINPNGVLVGADAIIDTQSFIASTLDVSNADFMAGGNLTFAGGSDASVVNEGNITALGGDVFLIARTVKNTGTIEAVDGTVGFAAGSEVLLKQAGDDRLFVQAGATSGEDASGASIDQAGTIEAAHAELKAAGGNVYALAINNTGSVRATGVSSEGGRIRLVAKGGYVRVAGTLDAAHDDAHAGIINVVGEYIELHGATLIAAGPITLRADANADGTGIVTFTGGAAHVSGGGDVAIYYNPLSYANPAGYSENVSITDGGTLTAWMLVNDVDDLQALNTNLAGTYALGGNIDAGDTVNWNDGAGFAPIGDSPGSFTGVFDGQSYTITDLFIHRPDRNQVGLFGMLGTGGEIRNVSLINGDVTGDTHVGGLVGISFGTISQSYATGAVSGNGNVGGLVGGNSGTISQSYTTGAVIGDYEVGGLVGINTSTISQSYATGAVTGISTGGLVGYSWHAATITDSFWDTDTTGQTTSAGGTGKTTAELLDQSTYTDAGWDFDNTWFMIDGETRPFLRMEHSTTVTNANQLQLMAMDLNADYTLAGDLDLADALANAGGMWSERGFKPVGDYSNRFVGTFDGDGHTITGLFIDRGDTPDGGLFGVLGVGGEIREVGLIDGDVTGSYSVGGLVGQNHGTVNQSYATGAVNGDDFIGGLVGYNIGTINQSHATGAVNGDDGVGGLVGNSVGTISHAYATGAVSGHYGVGGLVGANAGTISHTYATGAVSVDYLVGGLVGYNVGTISHSHATGAVSGEEFVGGLVGQNDNEGTINQSYATGAVSGVGIVGGLVAGSYGTINQSYATGTVSGVGVVGGLMGGNYGTINQSYATGAVNGDDGVGGLVGTNAGIISHAYATGAVTGDDFVGGLMGYNIGTINQSYATGAVTGSTNVGGLAGYDEGSPTVTDSFWNIDTTGQETSAGGTGLTTEQMRQQATFEDAGWDFDTVWAINQDVSPPHHQWRFGPGDPGDGEGGDPGNGSQDPDDSRYPDGFEVIDSSSGNALIVHADGRSRNLTNELRHATDAPASIYPTSPTGLDASRYAGGINPFMPGDWMSGWLGDTRTDRSRGGMSGEGRRGNWLLGVSSFDLADDAATDSDD